MKVLMINSVCGIGSTGRICTDIADALIADGHECKIAYGRSSVPEKYKDISYHIGGEFAVRLNGVKARLFDNEGFNAKRATKKLVNWIKTYNPDVIHLHNLHGYYLNVKILFDYLKTCGKKIVWTLHDCWSFTGHCSYFTLVKCEQWQSHCSYCPQKNSYPKAFRSKAKKNFDKKRNAFTGVLDLTIVTPSKWLADLVEKSFLKEYPIEVINNGIDLTVFKPTESDFREKHGLQDKKIILGVASVWDKRKGLDDFFELAKIISDDYRIVLVGLNDKQLKRLPKNVIGVKRTNSVAELAGLYSTADVYITTSVEETFGMTVVESLACETPAIVYNKSALSELVNCGAILCYNSAVNELANMIVNENYFIKNKNIKTKIDMVDNYMDIYISIGEN